MRRILNERLGPELDAKGALADELVQAALDRHEELREMARRGELERPPGTDELVVWVKVLLLAGVPVAKVRASSPCLCSAESCCKSSATTINLYSLFSSSASFSTASATSPPRGPRACTVNETSAASGLRLACSTVLTTGTCPGASTSGKNGELGWKYGLGRPAHSAVVSSSATCGCD